MHTLQKNAGVGLRARAPASAKNPLGTLGVLVPQVCTQAVSHNRPAVVLAPQIQQARKELQPLVVLSAEKGPESSPSRPDADRQSPPKGMAGSGLPPRPKKDSKVPNAGRVFGKGGAGGGGFGGGPGGPSWRPSAAATAGSISVYTGLVGTAAVVLAAVNHIDLVGSFQWNAEDVALGLSLILPIQLFNAAILGPSYSDWKLPGLEGLEAQLSTAEGKEEGVAASTTASSSASAQDASSPLPPSTLASERDATATASTSAPSSLPNQAQKLTDPEALKAEAETVKQLPKAAAQLGSIPASEWGKRPEGVRLGKPSLPILRDAMHLAQGHYVSNNPTARLGPAAESGVLLLDCLAGEMLYRGVALTLAAHWICDRLYEAGADDIMVLGLGPLSISTSPDDLSRWAAAGGVLLFVVFSVVRKVLRTLTRTTMVLELAGNMPAAGSTNSNAPQPGTVGKGGKRDKAMRLRKATAVPPGTFDALIYAAIIQGVRDASQTLALNAAFILTGNLAASYVASVANQLVLSAMQRMALDRMRRRSRDMARELRAYQDRLKQVADRAKARAAEKVMTAQAQAPVAGVAPVGSAADGSVQPQPAVAAATGASVETPTAADAVANAADGAVAAVADMTVAVNNVVVAVEEVSPPSAASIDATATPPPPSPSPSPASTAAAAPATGADPAPPPAQPLSRSQRTLMLLDALVPEPPKPVKQAAGSKAPVAAASAAATQPKDVL